MDEQASPFVVGQRVALVNTGGFGPTHYGESVVEKVYKNGRFVIRGYGQYRPEYSHFNKEWQGIKAGSDRYSSPYALAWDDRVAGLVDSAKNEAVRRQRWRSIQDRIARLRFYTETTTDAMMDQIEAALPTDE